MASPNRAARTAGRSGGRGASGQGFADVYIEVQGLNEFIRELRRVEKDLPKAVAEANWRAANETLVRRIAAAAPRLSGRLGGSVRAARQQRRAGIAVGTNVKVPYAGVINFGWPARNIRAQEFVYSTIHKSLPEFMDKYVEEINDLSSRAFPIGRL